MDAACGVGSFLPLMIELIGAGGEVSAIDLALENVKAVKAKAAQNKWSNLTSVDVGSVLAFPCGDQSFDAVCASIPCNIFPREKAHSAIAEFRRVVRSSGLFALKDYDPTGQQLLPLPYTLCLHRYEAMARGRSQTDQGLLRTSSTTRRESLQIRPIHGDHSRAAIPSTSTR